jgi:hypothetical protein
MTPTPPPPPQQVGLINDAARAPDSLTVNWLDVAGATSYDARITDPSGNTTMKANVTRPVTFDSLVPTDRYVIAARAVNNNGASQWSADFATRTRPATPPAPSATIDAVIPVFIVTWSIAGPSGGTVSLRQVGNGSDTEVVSGGPLTGSQAFSSIPSGVQWQFLSQLTVPAPDLPGSTNVSFWGPATTIVSVPALSTSDSMRKTYGPVQPRIRL